ncbi:MAG TPA: response regulator [Pyrinomonadaceae bacterium]|jgi:DNA-binding response OmpR family regulator|nr:response regulator [Pyrinomonadaceae bacterium]
MQSNKHRILVAEDHDDTRELFVLVLEQCHYEVVTTTSVSGTLDLTKSQRFDALVLDSRLRDGSGIDLCRSIRQTDKATPILFCSALAFERDKQEALSAGAQGYLIKPLNFSELCQSVEALIADSRKYLAPLTYHKATGHDSGDLPPSIARV